MLLQRLTLCGLSRLLLLHHRLALRGLSASRLLLLHHRLTLGRLLLLHDLTLTRLRSSLFLLNLRLSRNPLLSAWNTLFLLLTEGRFRRLSPWRLFPLLLRLTHLLLLLLLLSHLLLLRRGALLLTLGFALLLQLLLLSLLRGLLTRGAGALLSFGFPLLFQLLLLLSLLRGLLARGAGGLLSFELSLLLHLLPRQLLLGLLLCRAGWLRRLITKRPARALFLHQLSHFALCRLVALFSPACELAHPLRLDQRLRQTIRTPPSRHLGRVVHLQLVAPLLLRDGLDSKPLCEVSAHRENFRC